MLSFLLYFSFIRSVLTLNIPAHDILSTPKSAKRLLSRARRLGNGDEDGSWMSGYSIKFGSCLANASCDEGGCTSLVHFSLCPASSSCASGCSGGTDYLVDIHVFVDAFTEAQLGADEYACEMAREACGDDNGCYASSGIDYCEAEQRGNFNLQEYLECNQFGNDGYDPFYLGPYCSSDGDSIHLGIYTDDSCSVQESDDTFNNVFGYNLDYSASSGYSIVTNKCASCKQHQNENGQAGDGILQQCEDLYSSASSCAEDFDGENPDPSACGFVGEVKSNMAQRGHYHSEMEFLRRLFIVGVIIALLLCCFW